MEWATDVSESVRWDWELKGEVKRIVICFGDLSFRCLSPLTIES